MASSRLHRLAKVRPDLPDPRPGHLVRAVRRPLAALVVPLQVVRLRMVRRRVVRLRVVPAARAVLAARLLPAVRVVPAVRAVLVVRRSTVPAIRSAARPARASCR